MRVAAHIINDKAILTRDNVIDFVHAHSELVSRFGPESFRSWVVSDQF